MSLTYFFAQVFGIVMTTIGLAFFANRRQMLEIVRELLDNRALIFVVGIFTLIVGSIFTLTHNIWGADFLTTVVTLLCWLTLVRGALIILLPHGTVRRIFKALNFEQSYYAIGLIVLVLGLYLAYAGFFLV